MSNTAKNIVIAPKNAKSGNVYQINLRSRPKFFLINTDQIYLIQQAKLSGSCLIDNYLSSSGTLYLIIAFDPKFLILSGLLKKPDSFCSFEDILEDCNLSSITELNTKVFEIERICDVKTHENKLYIRVDQTKLIEWTQTKFEAVYREVMMRVPWAEGTFNNGEMAKKVSLGILFEFMDSQFLMGIYSQYTLESVNNAGRIFHERKQPSADLKHLGSAKKLQKKIEPPKVDRNQKTLSSFFGKKPK